MNNKNLNISIKSKLILSYAVIIIATLLVLGWVMEWQLGSQLNVFYDELKEMGFRPHDHPGYRGKEIFEEQVRSAILITILSASIVAILLAGLISNYITKPLGEVIETTKAIARGDYKKRVDCDATCEINELKDALNKMADCLEEHQIMQEELITNVSHELATPLTSLQGYIEAMQDGLIKGEKQEEALGIMLDETNRLGIMLKEMRELASIQDPKFRVKKIRSDLKKLSQSVIRQMKGMSKENNLTVELKSSLDSEVRVDPNRYKQILMNLMSNAIKHAEKDSIIHVNLSHDKKGRFAQLSITNMGKPVHKGDLPYLFDRFYRADKSRAKDSGGLGVGLAIVKELVEAHDGKVSVVSKDKETQFMIQLPLK